MLRISLDEFRNEITESVIRQGISNKEEASIITDVLMYAELRGNNQGIVKLISNALRPSSEEESVKIIHQTPVSARIDGGHKMGMIVMNECVNLAISKAKTLGIGIVGCFNYSSSTGALGYWARKIAQENLIAIVMSQCPEMVAPHGSFEPIFGTNPLAFGIPTTGRCQVFDMATSAIAWYGVVSADQEGKDLPENVAYDSQGSPTINPKEALKGALRVFDQSFKGSHLSLMVELLSGAWPGASMTDKSHANNWGSLIIAMDPNLLCPLEEFQERCDQMCNRVKHAKPLPGSNQSIFLPGERGDALEQQHIAANAIEVDEYLWNTLKSFQ